MGQGQEIPLKEYDETVLCAVSWRQAIMWLASGGSAVCGLFVLAAIPEFGPGAPLVTFAAFIALAVVAFLIGRSGLLLKADEVQWRDKWRTRHLRWEDIEGFELSVGTGRPAASVKLVDGEVVPFQILAGSSPGEVEKARTLIDELRARLRHQQEAGSRVAAEHR